MKTSKLFKILAVAAVLAGLGAAGYALWGKRANDAGNALPTATVTRGRVESVVTAQGKLEPKEYVEVGAEVSGQIKKLYFDVGDTVQANELIADIDPSNYEAEVKADEARIKQLEAQLTQQEANVEQAQLKLARNKTLVDAKAVSREVYEDAQTALKIAQAQLMSLEAQMQEAQSILEGDLADLERTKIYAPMAGTIVSLAVKEGQTINANQTAPVIGQVAQLDVMTVRAQVAEADITKLSPNMPVYFTTLGSQGRRWQGQVRQILPSPETVNDVVLYNVLADVENTDGQLMTGMTTQLFFVLGRAEDVPVVPVGALTKRLPDADTQEGRAYELQVLEGRITAPRTVLIGLSDRTNAQVVQGLAEGDTIVLSGPAAAGGAQGQQPQQRGGAGRMPRL